MAKSKSGRYSRFPAVNRDIEVESNVAEPDPEPEEVVLPPVVTPVGVAVVDLVVAEPAPEESAADETTGDDVADEISEDDAAPVDGEVAEETIEVPDVSAAKLLEWIGDDDKRRLAALQAELAREHPRATALVALG